MSERAGAYLVFARVAAIVSAMALFSLEGWAALQRRASGRPFVDELVVSLAVALPFLAVACLPRPRAEGSGRWIGGLFIGVAYLTPVLGIASTPPGTPSLRLILPLLVLCQIVMIAGGIEILRLTDTQPAVRRFGGLFWALVLTALSPAGLLFGVSLVTRTHGPPHEAAAISDIRAMMSAELAFVSASRAYGTPRCLVRPSDCIEAYPASAPAFAQPELVELVRLGYLRSFHGSPLGASDMPLEEALDGYVVVAVPLEPGVSGVRSFCGDQSGRICAYPDGRVPRIQNSGCPLDCGDLQ